ncbi:metal-sensitive transcriptional regulator [Rubeoparvulum massiliense]|uniref:metal-sensitive transcriptional regulator n=1 Tax=Rubeoparvulum massiliense TaxID=1631346 RepID=UPI00065DE97A|nr:metal-sensitive transcriptional regulator [Rubeoparvulum massiliense]
MQYDRSVVNRLKRIEGQARGVIRMMDEEKGCKDVVTQLSAMRAAIDRAILYVVGNNMEHCIRENIESGNDNDEVIKEAINLLLKTR